MHLAEDSFSMDVYYIRAVIYGAFRDSYLAFCLSIFSQCLKFKYSEEKKKSIRLDTFHSVGRENYKRRTSSPEFLKLLHLLQILKRGQATYSPKALGCAEATFSYP